MPFLIDLKLRTHFQLKKFFFRSLYYSCNLVNQLVTALWITNLLVSLSNNAIAVLRRTYHEKLASRECQQQQHPMRSMIDNDRSLVFSYIIAFSSSTFHFVWVTNLNQYPSLNGTGIKCLAKKKWQCVNYVIRFFVYCTRVYFLLFCKRNKILNKHHGYFTTIKVSSKINSM